MMKSLDQDLLTSRLKHIVADLFRLDLPEPDKISDHEPLIGGNLGLDHLDALELAMCIEEEFGVTLPSREESDRAFANIASLVAFIVQAHASASPVREHRRTPDQNMYPALPSPSLS